LIAVTIEESEIESVKSQIGKLPAQWRELLVKDHGLKPYDAGVMVGQGVEVVEYFLAVAEGCGNSKMASNWVGQEVLRFLNESGESIEAYPVSSAQMTELLSKVNGGELDQTRGKEVLQEMIDSKLEVQAAMDKLGIKAVDNSEIESLCQQLIDDNPVIGGARKINPNANPGLVKETILKMLGV